MQRPATRSLILIFFLNCLLCNFVVISQESQFGYISQPLSVCEQQQKEFQESESELYSEDNSDRYLYRPLVELLAESDLATTWLKERDGVLCLRSYNQGNIGSCVGNATALCVSIRAAWEIVEEGEDEELVAMAAADGIYGLAREASGLTGKRFDGATGYGAAKAIKELGTLWQLKYSTDDLTEYDVKRCEKFGYYGVGETLKQDAKKHPVLEPFAIDDFNQAWSALGRGIPINVCSNIGFNSKRDSTGTCQPCGTWGHSMAVVGRRTLNGKRQVLIMNSWGDDWNAGSYCDDMPFGSFWVDESVFSKMLSQKDSFGYNLFGGFPCEEYDEKNIIWIKL